MAGEGPVVEATSKGGMEVDNTDDVGTRASTTGQVVDWFANVARSDLRTSVNPEADSRSGSADSDQGKAAGSGDGAVGVIRQLIERSRRLPIFVYASLAVAAVILFAGFTAFGSDQTPRQTTDEATQEAAIGHGSFDSPYPLGLNVTMNYNDLEVEEGREWRVQVLEAVLNKQTPVRSGQTADSFLAMARIRLTYQQGIGDGPVSDLRFNAIGRTGSVYPAKVEGCISQNERLDRTQVQVGQAVEGWICWPVPGDELADLIMAVEAVPADGVLYMELTDVANG